MRITTIEFREGYSGTLSGSISGYVGDEDNETYFSIQLREEELQQIKALGIEFFLARKPALVDDFTTAQPAQLVHFPI